LQDVPAALEAVRHLLKPGGIFAFSTPSASGVSARARLKHCLAHSPPDHWSIWHPAACARLLKSRGFRVREMRITGHHPERFPLVGAAVGAAAARGGEGSLLYRALTLVSRVAGMGDTFEVYAECTVTPPARGIHP
ncbi:MAG: class I SAM-dependent methyltransferase, partial [Spirochaetaceae bacterium]|nr:class I SAM-dependent methyltransferase [Spirochaetaceae bacterium]